ncbi:MAG: Stp1/IreP family PP2C-type Ser/Thr phosphatase [Gammaproteobacteria bacterium]|nr:Stp1/IreP family PP2C-type Ser/Thr phosphatase [Gammaproteobacteria bacterium]
MNGQTDKGVTRSNNEDSIGTEPSQGLMVLADGMGGYKAGEVASAIAVATIMSDLDQKLSALSTDIASITHACTHSVLLKDAINKANVAIFNAAESQANYKGMGTTLVAALFYNNRIILAHVGDSRAYRYRDKKLVQMTRDHTLLQELVDRGFYTADEARKSLNKNLVTRAMGIEPTVQIDIEEDLALENDIYFLCSDGLTDMLEDNEIHLTLNEFGDNLQVTGEKLIAKANEKGGMDNISVILTKVAAPFPAKPGWLDKLVNWLN